MRAIWGPCVGPFAVLCGPSGVFGLSWSEFGRFQKSMRNHKGTGSFNHWRKSRGILSFISCWPVGAEGADTPSATTRQDDRFASPMRTRCEFNTMFARNRHKTPLEPFQGVLETSWTDFGPVLGPPWRSLGVRLGAVLGQYWSMLCLVGRLTGPAR